MRTSLRKVGNSRGIIIPAMMLVACDLGDEVELTLQGKKLVVEALQEPRKGWFANYQAVDDVDVLADLSVGEGDEEWAW